MYEKIIEEQLGYIVGRLPETGMKLRLLLDDDSNCLDSDYLESIFSSRISEATGELTTTERLTFF